MSVSAAPAPLQTLQDALKKAAPAMSAVAARMVTPEKLIKIAVAAAQRTPLLLQCTPTSIVRAVIQGAELGLTPGSALNQAYLVPFKNSQQNCWEAQLIVSAQGLSELAYRSGLISFITAEVVYEGDDFDFELGLEPKLKHRPSGLTVDSSKITHAYMVVGLKDGTKAFRVMTRAEIDRIRGRSPSAKSGRQSPWDTDYAEMARKTVIKNGMKYVPKSIEVARAVALDNAQETGDWSIADFETPEALPESSVAEAEGTSEKVAKKIKSGDSAAVLILTENEQRDFQAYCDSKGVDAAAELSKAVAAGVADVAGLYALVDGGLGL